MQTKYWMHSRTNKKRFTLRIGVLCLVCLVLYTTSKLWVDQVTHRAGRPEIIQEQPLPVDTNDWPQWHGPNRDNLCMETGLLKAWPDKGPRVIWQCDALGEGWSSPTLARAHIYVTGTEKRKEFLSCLDSTGRTKWTVFYGSACRRYPGTRSTPTFDNTAVYVISGTGEVVCIDTQKEMIKWKLDGSTVFQGQHHHFGVSESPLVFDDKVFFTPGGNQTTMVALNKQTGQTIWQSPSLKEQTGYVSPMVIPWWHMMSKRDEVDLTLETPGPLVI